MDTIIDQYFKMQDIPMSRKRNLAVDLDSGQMTETGAREILLKKYPDKFNLPGLTEGRVASPNDILAMSQESKGIIPTATATGKPLIERPVPLADIPGGMMSTEYGAMDEASILGNELGWTEQERQYFRNLDPESQRKIRLSVSGATPGTTPEAAPKPTRSPLATSALGAFTSKDTSKAVDIMGSMMPSTANMSPMAPKKYPEFDSDQAADEIASKLWWTDEQKQKFLTVPENEQVDLYSQVFPLSSTAFKKRGESIAGAVGAVGEFGKNLYGTGKALATADLKTPEGLKTLVQTTQGAQDVVTGVGKALWDRTLGGVSGAVAGQYASSYRGIEGQVAGLKALLEGKSFEEADKIRQQVQTEPIDVMGTNYNWFKSSDGETVDFVKSVESIAGSEMKGLGSAMNIISAIDPAKAVEFGWNFLAGGTYGAGEAIQEGEGVRGAIRQAIIDGTLQGTVAKLVGITQNHLAKAKLDKAQKLLIKKGYTPDQAALLSKMTPEQQALWKDYIKVQSKFAAAGGQGDDVFTYAGKELDDFFSKGLDQVDKAVKAQYKAAAEGLKGAKVPTTSLKNSLDDMINSIRVPGDKSAIVKNIGTAEKPLYHINFSKTTMRGVPSDVQTLFDDMYNLSTKGSVDAAQLAQWRVFVNETMSPVKGKMYTPTIEQKYLVSFKNSIDDTLANATGLSKEAKAAFSKALNDYRTYYEARNAIYQLGVDKVGDSLVFRGDRLLRQLQQVNRPKAQQLLKVIEETGAKLGIKVPQNIADKSYMATIIEGLSGKSPALGFKASINTAVSDAQRQIGQIAGSPKSIVRELASKTYGAVTGEMPKTTPQILNELNTIVQQAWQQSANKGVVQLSKEAMWKIANGIAQIERVSQYGYPENIGDVAGMAGGAAKFLGGAGTEIVKTAVDGGEKEPTTIENTYVPPVPEYTGGSTSYYE